MLSGKLGFFAPATATHAEAADWASRVTAAGGTYSAATLAAVSQFCNDIDNAGIRGRFYRLNLFCGNFTAALVPLYRNTSSTGSVLGNSTDTNNNFVSGDYSETGSSAGGLKGNGSTKYLATGLNPVSISASVNNFHLGLYAKGTESTGTSRAHIGNNLGQTPEAYIGWTASGTTETANIGGDSSTRLTAPAGTKEGLLLITKNSSTTQQYYLNAATPTSSTNTVTNFTDAGIDVFRAGTFYSLARYIRYYSIGLGLSSAQVSSLRNALTTFQTALSRNV